MAAYVIKVSLGQNGIVYKPFICLVDQSSGNDPNQILLVIDETQKDLCFQNPASPFLDWIDQPDIGIFKNHQLIAGKKVILMEDFHTGERTTGYWSYQVRVGKCAREGGTDCDDETTSRNAPNNRGKNPVIINK